MIRSCSIAALSALLTLAPAWAQDHADHGAHHPAEHAHDHAGEVADLGDLPETLAAAVADGAQLVTVDVLGMVCDFCATALTKTLSRRDEVAGVHVDLDAKTVSLALHAGRELDDATLDTLVTRAGYKLSAVHRGGVHASDAP